MIQLSLSHTQKHKDKHIWGDHLSFTVTNYREVQGVPDTVPEGGVAPPPLDSAWAESTRKKALLKLEKLDTDLKNYKGNSIKESIRYYIIRIVSFCSATLFTVTSAIVPHMFVWIWDLNDLLDMEAPQIAVKRRHFFCFGAHVNTPDANCRKWLRFVCTLHRSLRCLVYYVCGPQAIASNSGIDTVVRLFACIYIVVSIWTQHNTCARIHTHTHTNNRLHWETGRWIK